MRVVRFVSVTCLLLFVGLRYHTGADWGLYEYFFENLPIEGNFSGWESGYVLLSKTIFYLFGNYYVLQFLASFIFIYALSRFFEKNSDYPIFAFSIFLFIYFISLFMAQVRQSIALSVILLSTNYIFKRNFIKYALMVALACMFHISAIVAIILYFLNTKWSKTFSLFIILVSQVFYFFPGSVLKIVDIIVPLMPQRIGEIAQDYLNSLFANKAQFNTGLFYIVTVIISTVSVLLANKDDEKMTFFSNSLVVAIVIMSMANAMMIIARFQSYFYVYGIVCIVNLLNIKIKNINSYAIKSVIASILFLFFSFKTINVIRSNNISSITNRVENYALVPYYNVISYPQEATERLDWYN